MNDPKQEESVRKSAQARRDFILSQAQQAGFVTDKEIEEAGIKGEPVKWSSSAQSLKDDAKYFKTAKSPIYRPFRKKKFIYEFESRLPYQDRKSYQVSQKQAIGQLGADLIRGADRKGTGVVYAKDDIYSMLAKHEKIPGHEEAFRRVTRKLNAIYAKYDRVCALDSGTTTLQVAQAFEAYAKHMFPDTYSSLKALTILTNSTDIATALGDPLSGIQVIMLGGRLRKETQAFAGSLAKISLEAFNLHLDMSIVGVVGLEKRKQFFGSFDQHEMVSFMSDTFEEAETKQALFARSTLRIVAMTSEKLKSEAERDAEPITMGHFAFAKFSGDVDIVITNEDPSVEAQINQCWENGIAVLAAPK